MRRRCKRHPLLILCSLICVLLIANLCDLVVRYQINLPENSASSSDISDVKIEQLAQIDPRHRNLEQVHRENSHGINAQQNDDWMWIQEMSDVYERAPLKNPDKDPFVKQNNTADKCNDFHSSFKENLQKVLKYSFNVPEKYLKLLHLDRVGIKNITSKVVDSPYPILASATSSNHYNEIQGLIRDYHQNLLPLYPNMKLILYDLGLNKNQLEQMKKYCKCEVRQFPFHSFPNHIRSLSGFGWKPLIIQLLLIEFDFLMWADASVRFNGNPLNKLIDGAKEVGVQIIPGWGSIAVRTNPRTFAAFGEQMCMFDYPELEATWMAFKRSEFTLTAVMKPWVSCALQYGCMDFDKSKSYLRCPRGKKQRLGSCHRFDQSVIGIILTRLFNHKSHLCQFIVNGIGSIKRGEYVKYFPK